MVKRYPLLEIVSAHGRKAAAIGAALALVVAAGLGVIGVGAPLVIAAALAAPVLYVALRLVAEIVEVIADTLMPR